MKIIIIKITLANRKKTKTGESVYREQKNTKTSRAKFPTSVLSTDCSSSRAKVPASCLSLIACSCAHWPAYWIGRRVHWIMRAIMWSGESSGILTSYHIARPLPGELAISLRTGLWVIPYVTSHHRLGGIPKCRAQNGSAGFVRWQAAM